MPRKPAPYYLYCLRLAALYLSVSFHYTMPPLPTRKGKTMRLTMLAAALLLAACAAPLPQPHSLPPLPQSARWFKLEKADAAGQTVQTSLLAVEPLSDGLRFVQTDALGAPVSRQTVSTQGWKNDGFVMPNAASRRLFAALLPLLATDDAASLYPEITKRPSENNGFCPEGKGALFRYKDRDLWCVAADAGQFRIGFPDNTRWTAAPIEEQAQEQP